MRRCRVVGARLAAMVTSEVMLPFCATVEWIYLKIRLDTSCLLHNHILFVDNYLRVNMFGKFLRKVGEIRVRDSCARKKVEYGA